MDAFGIRRHPGLVEVRQHSSVTAAAAALAQRSGTAGVVLFADLANPTANGIYQKIGFEAVADSVRITFGPV